MNKNQKILFTILLIIVAFLAVLTISQIVWPNFHFGNLVIFHPKGPVAFQERNLIIIAVSLMLVAVLPVYFMLFFFASKYREGKQAQNYSPDMQSGKPTAILFWAIPATIIFIIAIINWKSTHALDPYKPIASNKKPITIQVVALRWKWLFIYPEQNIATVNYVEFPVDRPVSFMLTADDAPMSSFWVPELGGQMYAMAGMQTQLHLLASEQGDYQGSAAEINGAGFAGMRFTAKAVPQSDFDNWIKSLRTPPNPLTPVEYSNLSKPSENNSPAYYSSVDPDFFSSITAKYMSPLSAPSSN